MALAAQLGKGQLTKLANLVMFEQPMDVCASVMGLTEEEIKEILNTDAFKITKSEVMQEEFERQDILKQGWDSIEALALNHVVDLLTSESCDPDYALKAAMVANKAQKRQLPDRVLQQPVQGAIVLKLEQHFVQQINDGQVRVAQKLQGNGRHQDFLAPEHVEKQLLGNDNEEMGSVDNEQLEDVLQKWA